MNFEKQLLEKLVWKTSEKVGYVPTAVILASSWNLLSPAEGRVEVVGSTGNSLVLKRHINTDTLAFEHILNPARSMGTNVVWVW